MTNEPTATPASPRREATEWFLTIQAASDPSPETLQKWLIWLEASPDNQRAFEDVARTWHLAARCSIAHRATGQGGDDYDPSMSIAEWRARRATRPSESALRRFRRPLIALAAAASLAMLAFIAQDRYQVFSTQEVISEGTFTTRTGEHLELTLADGSRVTLGGQSTLAIDFQPRVRRIRLDAGEAFFSVRKDPSRPFTVFALDGAITAVGTAFNVRAVEDRVTVTVTDGNVRVDEIALAEYEKADEALLARGEQLTYRPDKILEKSFEITPIRHVDPEESARWRAGWLVYRDEPLRYVIADVGRYTDLDLDVEDSAADLEFSGAVFKDRIAEWLAALPEVARVTVERSGTRVTIRTRGAGTVAHK